MYNAVNFNLTYGNYREPDNFRRPTEHPDLPERHQERLGALSTRRPRTRHSTSFQRHPAPGQLDRVLQQLRRQRRDLGLRVTRPGRPEHFREYNGTIYNDSSVKIAGITDGTSNTFLFAEHSHAMAVLNDPIIMCRTIRGSRAAGTTRSSRPYPMTMNLQGNLNAANGPFGYYAITVANSLHPGGANFAFCDGSVHSSSRQSVRGPSVGTTRTPTAMRFPMVRPLRRTPMPVNSCSGSVPLSSAYIRSSRPGPAAKSSVPTSINPRSSHHDQRGRTDFRSPAPPTAFVGGPENLCDLA